MCSYIGITVHFIKIFPSKSCTMLCWLADDHNLQLEEIVSNFEMINEQFFNVAGQCSSLMDVV